MSAIDIDELAQKFFGVHCCCSANLPKNISSMDETQSSGRTEIATKGSNSSRRPIPSHQSSGHLNYRIIDIPSQNMSHVYASKKFSEPSKSSEPFIRRSPNRACITAENALVGAGRNPASGDFKPYLKSAPMASPRNPAPSRPLPPRFHHPPPT